MRLAVYDWDGSIVSREGVSLQFDHVVPIPGVERLEEIEEMARIVDEASVPTEGDWSEMMHALPSGGADPRADVPAQV